MDIQFIDSVHSILNKVEADTGKPIEFIEKSDLPTFASLKMARSTMPSHIIFYKQVHDEVINHLVAHECGHLLRMFAAPADKRLIPYSDKEKEDKAKVEIKDDIKAISSSLSPELLQSMTTMWHQGLIRQLTNMPPDIMIEKWLYDEYPQIRPYQLRTIQKQLQEATAGLSDKIRIMTPGKIYDASHFMNYAFFRIVGFHLGVNFVKEYNNTKYVRRGKELAAITEKEYINTYEGDIKMITTWAEFLQLSTWFGWMHFESMPDNYLESH